MSTIKSNYVQSYCFYWIYGNNALENNVISSNVIKQMHPDRIFSHSNE